MDRSIRKGVQWPGHRGRPGGPHAYGAYNPLHIFRRVGVVEAERDRRAKIINAEGEYQAATRLAEASRIIEEHPTALQLRYLQTVNEMSAENNTTTIFPIPIDLLGPFTKAVGRSLKTTPEDDSNPSEQA